MLTEVMTEVEKMDLRLPARGPATTKCKQKGICLFNFFVSKKYVRRTKRDHKWLFFAALRTPFILCESSISFITTLSDFLFVNHQNMLSDFYGPKIVYFRNLKV